VGTKASKKWHKQHHHDDTTYADSGINERTGGSSAEHAAEVVGNKRQVRPPKDHSKKLLKETCSNHAYAIKHKLRDCRLMKSFMTTGSLSWGMEVDEAPSRMMQCPFPERRWS
jgi:hypothetical protein